MKLDSLHAAALQEHFHVIVDKFIIFQSTPHSQGSGLDDVAHEEALNS
jgi:hypothetical protein